MCFISTPSGVGWRSHSLFAVISYQPISNSYLSLFFPPSPLLLGNEISAVCLNFYYFLKPPWKKLLFPKFLKISLLITLLLIISDSFIFALKPGCQLPKYAHKCVCIYVLAKHLEKFLNFMQALPML
jgi:hypothetical protein